MRDLIAKGKARAEHFAIVFREIPGLTEAQAIEQGIRPLTQRGEPTAAYTQGKLLAERCTDAQYLLLKSGKLTQKAKRDILGAPTQTRRNPAWPKIAKKGIAPADQRLTIIKALQNAVDPAAENPNYNLNFTRHIISKGREYYIATDGRRLAVIERTAPKGSKNIEESLDKNGNVVKDAKFPESWRHVMIPLTDKAQTLDLAPFRYLETYPRTAINHVVWQDSEGKLSKYNPNYIGKGIKFFSTLSKAIGSPSIIQVDNQNMGPILMQSDHDGWTAKYLLMPMRLVDGDIYKEGDILLNPQPASTNFSIKAVNASLFSNVKDAKAELKKVQGQTFTNGEVHAVVSGQAIGKTHAAQMSIRNLTALEYSEDEARKIHYSACTKIHEIFESAPYGFFEPNYDQSNKKGRDGAWHYFGVVNIAGYGEFDVNVSAIKPSRTHGENSLFTLELTIENPSEIGSDTLSQRGRALRSEGSSGSRLSAYRSFVEKEMAAIKKKAQNDGAFMKAPNGEPTNLTEKQWLTVRTQAFKNWFGDWERVMKFRTIRDAIMSMPVVTKLSGKEFQSDGVPLTDKVPTFWQDSYQGAVESPELGRVVLDKEGVKSSMGHGIGSLKSAAFYAVPEVIRKGKVFDRQQNWKGRGYDTAVLAAPISIGGTEYICEVIVEQRPNRQGFYLHEVVVKEKLGNVFKTSTKGGTRQASRSILALRDSEVNSIWKNCSKVVDANGEPLVVYHGTPTGGFTIFRDESYFSPLMWYAEKYKNPAASSNRSSRDVGTPMLYEVFLNIRKPFDTRNAAEKKIFETDFFRKWGNGAPLSERGLPDWTDATDLLEFIEENELDYDGLILDEGGYPDGNGGVILRGHSFVPVSPNQIKSATDNRGTFDGSSPDITFSIKPAAEDTLDRFTVDPLGERIIHHIRTESRRYARLLGDKTPYEQAVNAAQSAASIISAVDKFLHTPGKPVPARYRRQLQKLRSIAEKYAQIIASGTPRSFKKISPQEKQELEAAIADLEAAELDTAETDPALLIEDDKRMNKRTREARSREHHRAIVREAAKGRVYKVLAAMLDTTADALGDYLKDQLLTKLHRLTSTVKIKRSPSKRLQGKQTAPTGIEPISAL